MTAASVDRLVRGFHTLASLPIPISEDEVCTSLVIVCLTCRFILFLCLLIYENWAYLDVFPLTSNSRT
jgi:hypothetical protein